MLSDVPQSLWMIAVVMLGLVLGSFSTALTYRIPRKIPWAFKDKKQNASYRSRCTDCETILAPLDLIPFFSWAFFKGKCRHCKASIGLTYPFIEAGTTMALLASFLILGPSLEFAAVAIVLPFLMALTMIDIEKMILPNQLVLIVFVVGFVYQSSRLILKEITWDVWASEYMLGTVVYGGAVWLLGAIMTVLLKKNALGFGDVKFFAAAGVWLGLSQIGLFCFLSGILGIILSATWSGLKKKEEKTGVFPFGPALILSFFVLFHLDGSKILEFVLK